MRVLNEMEIGSVNGGSVCDGLSIAQCTEGSVEQLIKEFETAKNYVSESSWFQQLQSWGGDLGIWIYNTTHGC